jgi:hypothetical protein
MTSPPRRIVLVSRHGRAWLEACEKALKERGIQGVKTYSCWSADVARELHDGEAVVTDGRALCDFVSPERPGPVLSLSPKLPVVIFNAEELDEPHRSAAMAHNALMVDGDDIAEIARRVEGLLPPG